LRTFLLVEHLFFYQNQLLLLEQGSCIYIIMVSGTAAVLGPTG
jgi:hypothetical protein